MNKNSERVLITSDEAAKFVTNIEGWVDRHGRFWGKDEYIARWSGCTHVLCKDCGMIIPKEGFTVCGDCREAKAVERYKLREQKQWDGQTPLYSEVADEYFFDGDSLQYYLEDSECTIQDLRLVICDPVKLSEITDEFFCEDLPEEGEVPSDVLDAMDELNRVIQEQGPVSWVPGKYAVEEVKRAIGAGKTRSVRMADRMYTSIDTVCPAMSG